MERETAEDQGAPLGVVVLSGPPCSGKSSVSRILAADSLRALARSVHIEVDALFALLLPESDRGGEDRMLAYDAAHALARMIVERGRLVVLECTYARQEQRASLLRALFDTEAAPLWVVEFFVSPEDAVERFRGREEATDLDELAVRERAESFPYFDSALRLPSAASAPNELARHLTDWLRGHPVPVSRDAWASAGRGWD